MKLTYSQRMVLNDWYRRNAEKYLPPPIAKATAPGGNVKVQKA